MLPLINRTQCCEAAILSSATDHTSFTLNFALWNLYVQRNNSIPPLLPSTPENTAWNALVEKWRTNPQHEYLDFRCGAVYSKTDGNESPAAMSIHLSLAWCRQTAVCMGFQGVPLAALDQWAGPLVGFLLPAIVFGLSIQRSGTSRLRNDNAPVRSVPQLKRAGRIVRLLGALRQVLGPPVILAAGFAISVLETIYWVAVVLTCAGPILASALHEMYLNHILLAQLSHTSLISAPSGTSEFRRRSLLLAILLSNVSDATGSLALSAAASITNASAPQANAALGILLATQTPFSVAVGAPVAFYTLAYGYALFDACQHLGDYLTAVALTFGLWYTAFVLIAMVSGCLLACSNTAIIEKVVRPAPLCPPVHLVAPWHRGRCAQDWAARQCGNYHDRSLTTPLSTWSIAVLSILLISLPCGLAFPVSYRTPDVGLGCRTLSLLLYWASQVLLILVHAVYSTHLYSPTFKRSPYTPPLFLLLLLTLLLSFSAGVGGTVLQISGLYINPYCLAGARSFIDSDSTIWWLDIATDTELVRNLARYRWRYTGLAGLAVLGGICVGAWWYQQGVRRMCAAAIEGVKEIPRRTGGRDRSRRDTLRDKLPVGRVAPDPTIYLVPAPASSPLWGGGARTTESLVGRGRD